MNHRCPECGLINYVTVRTCIRCGTVLGESVNIASNRRFLKSSIVKRAAVCLLVVFIAILGFYASLVASADALTADEQVQIRKAIDILDRRGFTQEVFLLEHFTVFRGNDNWLNASVPKENAYAATNFPFEIITIYPDFFTYTVDDTERAAILLHEARHLLGDDEKEAYEYVWKNRNRLGWTFETHSRSVIWRETRKLTKEHLPNMFVCDFNDYGDCT